MSGYPAITIDEFNSKFYTEETVLITQVTIDNQKIKGISDFDLSFDSDDDVANFYGYFNSYVKVIFSNCDISNITLVESSFIECQFINCTFKNITVDYGCIFTRCQFRSCTFDGLIHITTLAVAFIENSIDLDDQIKTSIEFSDPQQIVDFKERNSGYDSKNPEDNVIHDLPKLHKYHTYGYVYNKCPDGDFIAWKTILAEDKSHAIYLVKLLIPADAERSSWIGDKCRASYAKVLAIYNQEGAHIKKVNAICFATDDAPVITTYEEGKNVYPDSYDPNRENVCSHGIHFFIDKQQAMNYLGFKFY